MAKLNKVLIVHILGDFHISHKSTKEIAEQYGVSQRQIQMIVKGEVWKEEYELIMSCIGQFIKEQMEREMKMSTTKPSTFY